MTRLTAGDAQIAADLMSRLHPGWDLPGARRLLLDAADLAPAHELAAAGVLFAGMTPGLKVPLADKFRDRSQPWWRALPEAARTVRPSDAPKCATHGMFLRTDGKCIDCLADEKGSDESAPVVMLTDEQKARNAAWLARIKGGAE